MMGVGGAVGLLSFPALEYFIKVMTRVELCLNGIRDGIL